MGGEDEPFNSTDSHMRISHNAPSQLTLDAILSAISYTDPLPASLHSTGRRPRLASTSSARAR